MTNWLERAKRELGLGGMGDLSPNSQIPKGAGRGTAVTDERHLTAVTAVPHPGESENAQASIGSNGSEPAAGFREIEGSNEAVVPMTAGEGSAVRAWLAHIEETDEAIIAHVLDKCRTDADARYYFIRRPEELPRPVAFDDDRRRCDQCANLTGGGLCLAARRGEIVASRNYEPIRDLPRRCEGYAPKANDTDQRPARERWPGLMRQGDNHAND